MSVKRRGVPEAQPKRYRALNGINWPNPAGGEHRRERGDEITPAELPDAFAAGFIEHGDLEVLEDETAAAGELAAEEKE